MAESLAYRWLKWPLMAFLFSSLSIFFSYYIFPAYASILAISFLTIGLTPPLYGLLQREEAIVADVGGGPSFLRKYGSIIIVILLLSAGLYSSFLFWYSILPSDSTYSGGSCSTHLPCRESVFHYQREYVNKEWSLTDGISLILLCFTLSLFLGAGAILLIAWDLSSLVLVPLPGTMGFFIYLPTLFSFFFAGLSGVLLSFALVRHEWGTYAFYIVLKDAVLLLAISLLSLIVSFYLIGP